MKETTLFAAGIVLAASMLAGCSGSDSPPVASNAPVAGAVDERLAPQPDALTAPESAQVNQAESEPVPPQKSDS